jgi:hypothetical protein
MLHHGASISHVCVCMIAISAHLDPCAPYLASMSSGPESWNAFLEAVESFDDCLAAVAPNPAEPDDPPIDDPPSKRHKLQVELHMATAVPQTPPADGAASSVRQEEKQEDEQHNQEQELEQHQEWHDWRTGWEEHPAEEEHGGGGSSPSGMWHDLPANLHAEHEAAMELGVPWKDRGPPGPEDGGPTTWRGQQWRAGHGGGLPKWANRGGKHKHLCTAYYKKLALQKGKGESVPAASSKASGAAFPVGRALAQAKASAAMYVSQKGEGKGKVFGKSKG